MNHLYISWSDSVNIGYFKDNIGINSDDLYNIKFLVEIYVSKVITIENLVMVNSYKE